MAKKTASKVDEPDFMDMYEGSEGEGFENVSQDDLGIPFISILQKGSPECDEDHAKHVDGAKPGMIINSVTKEVLGGRGEPITFIPCAYHKLYVEWTPRERGGGFVGSHDIKIMEQVERDATGKDVLSNGNIIVTTAYFFGLLVEEGATSRCVVAFTSTQLKKARQWLSAMASLKMKKKDGTNFNPPMYSHTYHMSTLPESNDKGSWFGWKIDNAGVVGEINQIKEAKEVNRLVKSGGMQSSRLLQAHEATDSLM